MVNQQFATAVHIMTALAFLKSKKSNLTCESLNSEQLAHSIDTNPVVVRRLLSQLSKSGLVKTSRGKTGGVTLLKDMQNITLKDIYEALEIHDPITPHNKSPQKDCPVSCSIHSIMTHVSQEAHKSLTKYLESKKLSDLVKKIK